MLHHVSRTKAMSCIWAMLTMFQFWQRYGGAKLYSYSAWHKHTITRLYQKTVLCAILPSNPAGPKDLICYSSMVFTFSEPWTLLSCVWILLICLEQNCHHNTSIYSIQPDFCKWMHFNSIISEGDSIMQPYSFQHLLYIFADGQQVRRCIILVLLHTA